jgi:hypothetical protein
MNDLLGFTIEVFYYKNPKRKKDNMAARFNMVKVLPDAYKALE